MNTIRWFVYPLAFKHRIADREELVDKECLNTHVHGIDGDSATLKVGVKGEEWIDFKRIKQAVLDALYPYDNTGEMLEFGIADAETIIKMIGEEVADILQRDVTVYLQETEKYAISSNFCPK